MDLFWFHSHLFIIRILQACIFLLAIYLSLIFQYRKQFLVFSSSWNQFVSITLLLPLPIFLLAIPLTVPTYSMVIHIGQLVDLEVVQEAIEKVNKRIALENKKREEEERVKDEGNLEIFEVMLFREGTIASLSHVDQLKYKIAGFLFESFWESILTWICVIDAALIGLFITKSSFYTISVITHQIFSTVFLIELCLKVYSFGINSSALMKVNTGLMLDFISILFNFILSVLCTSQVLDLRFGLIVLLRLINVVRVPMANKVILEDLDKKLNLIPPQCQCDNTEMNAILYDPDSTNNSLDA